MRAILRRIGPGAAFRVAFFLAWWAGLAMSVVAALAYAGLSLAFPDLGALVFPELVQLAAPLGVLVVAVIGFLLAALGALAHALSAAALASGYNRLAGIIGGLEVDVEATLQDVRSEAPSGGASGAPSGTGVGLPTGAPPASPRKGTPPESLDS